MSLSIRKAMQSVVKQESERLRPCKNGHVGVRYKCRHCVECERPLSTDRREYMREYMRKYREKHNELLQARH